MNYTLGVCQFKPELLKVEKNLNNMYKQAIQIEADLVVFPELATSGYVFSNKDEVKLAAEHAHNGPTAELFRELARQNNTSYVVGFVESEDGLFYNSSMLVNPCGTVKIYRKTHLFYEEKLWFEPGNTGFDVFLAKNDVKVGMMICYDWMYPEAARTLAMAGAQVIAHCANLVLPWCQQAMVTRSLENRVYTITSNRIGTEVNGLRKQSFTGASQILNTTGQRLVQLSTDKEQIGTTVVDVTKALNKNVNEFNSVFTDRRPEMYF